MSFRIKLFLRVTLLLYLLPPAGKAIAQGIGGDEKKLQIGGFLETDHISYFKNYPNKINSRNQAILQLELRSKLNEHVSFFSGIEFRDDMSDKLRNRVYLDEGYMTYTQKNFDLRLGKQIITWGAADGINPTNNINPIDYTDLLDTDDERIGVFSLKGDYYLGNWTLEGILIPVYTPSILPQNGYTDPAANRWAVSLPAAMPSPFEAGGIMKATYDMQPSTLPARDFGSAQFAGKISSSLKGWDFSFSYYDGFDDLTMFRSTANVLSADSVHISIKPEYHKLKVPGIDFSTTFGKYGLRGEAAYFMTDDKKGIDPAVTDPFYMYVVGLDRNFGNVFGNNLFVIGQWIQQFIETGAVVSNTSLNNVFQKAAMTRMEYTLNSFSTITVQAIYDFKSRNYIIRPEFRYQICDGLNLGIYSDLMDGPENTFFGNYRNNKRIQVRVKYNF